MKLCLKCQTCKSESEFRANKRVKSGLHTYCKPCCKADFAAWRTRNAASWAIYQQAWRERNPEKANGYAKAAGYASQKRWGAANPAKRAELQAARAARKLQATPLWVDHEAIAEVYVLAQAYRAFGLGIDVDHVIPLQGKTVSGLHVAANLEVKLASDNRRKSNKFPT